MTNWTYIKDFIIHNKDLIGGIILILIGLVPGILFAFSPSTEVWSDITQDHEGQEDFTISNPNPLLGDKYMLIAGQHFSLYTGYINGNVTIMNKATGENQTFIIYIDATTSYQGWASDHHVVILPPGEYTIFWETTPLGVGYYIYSHGWFMVDHDDPSEVNGLHSIIIMVSGIYGTIFTVSGIYLVIRRRKY